MAITRKCSACSTEIEVGTTVCQNCGGKKFISSFGSKGSAPRNTGESEPIEQLATPHCTKCGAPQDSSDKFCGQCGSIAVPLQDKSSSSIFNRFVLLSNKGKFFYSSWILVNLIFISRFLTESSKPVDRFRSLCNWEGVNCAPSSQELANEALANLILWNILFLIFLLIYKKIKSKKQK